MIQTRFESRRASKTRQDPPNCRRATAATAPSVTQLPWAVTGSHERVQPPAAARSGRDQRPHQRSSAAAALVANRLDLIETPPNSSPAPQRASTPHHVIRPAATATSHRRARSTAGRVGAAFLTSTLRPALQREPVKEGGWLRRHRHQPGALQQRREGRATGKRRSGWQLGFRPAARKSGSG